MTGQLPVCIRAGVAGSPHLALPSTPLSPALCSPCPAPPAGSHLTHFPRASWGPLRVTISGLRALSGPPATHRLGLWPCPWYHRRPSEGSPRGGRPSSQGPGKQSGTFLAHLEMPAAVQGGSSDPRPPHPPSPHPTTPPQTLLGESWGPDWSWFPRNAPCQERGPPETLFFPS